MRSLQKLRHEKSAPCGVLGDTDHGSVRLHVLPLRQGLLLSCRDIKLENTLLDAHMPLPNVKLCDFGYSKNEFVDSRPKTVSGTPDYIAPEVLLNDQYDGKKADIWSCGVMLYVMLTGEVAPYSGKHSCMPCRS